MTDRIPEPQMLQTVLAFDTNHIPYEGVVTGMDAFANVISLYNPISNTFHRCLYNEVYESPQDDFVVTKDELENLELHPFDTQEGGNHYKDMAIQPTEYILANGLGFCEGNVVKYISRHEKKNGIEDVKKAKHYCEILIADLERKQEEAESALRCVFCKGIEDNDCTGACMKPTEGFVTGRTVRSEFDDLDIDGFANNISSLAINDAGIVTTGVDEDPFGENVTEGGKSDSYKEQGDDLPPISSYEEEEARAAAERDMMEDGWGPILTPQDLILPNPVASKKKPALRQMIWPGHQVRLADYIAGLSPVFYGGTGQVMSITNEGRVAWVKLEGSRANLPIGVKDLTVISPFSTSGSAA